MLYYHNALQNGAFTKTTKLELLKRAKFGLNLLHNPLIRGFLKGLSSNLDLLSSSSTEMYHFVMHYGSKAFENICKSFLKFPYLLIKEIILK